ncbi:MAG: [LysW]-lysine hydrolase [Gemmatimonadota bacterium]|nr:MAG: [LysW]-lysine hydrolase [Gemmatimonadota bacterium]
MDRGGAEELLEGLVRIASPSGHESAASHFLVDWMSRHGFDAQVDEVGNAVGVRGDGSREILLLGHIDTFQGIVPVRREGRLLFGRGTVDAKGPLAAFAVAAAAVEPQTEWRVTVVGAVEEEAASSRGARHILESRGNDPPIVCVIGEPSRWDRITLGYKGRLMLDAIMRVPLGHSAGNLKLPPELGVDLWRTVTAFCEERDAARQAQRAFDRLMPALQQMNSANDDTHGVVTLTIGFRLGPRDQPETLPGELEARLAEWARREGITDMQLRFAGAERTHKAPKATPLVRAFLASIRAAKGTPRFVLKTGTSDMNVVAPGWPATSLAAYGPGDSSLDHTPDEHIDLAEYARAVEVLTAVLTRLTV